MKKLLTIFCLGVLLIFPVNVSAEETVSSPYADRARQVYMYEDEEGGFDLFGSERTAVMYSEDNINFSFSLPMRVRLALLINDNEDLTAVAGVVEQCYKNYLSSLLSGRFQILSKDHFVSEGVYQEANSRTLYNMFAAPDAGLAIEGTCFSGHIDQLEIDGDWAKVIVSLDDKTLDEVPVISTISYEGQEGYLLKKVDGDWKIENIIFQSQWPNETMKDFRKSSTSAQWEQDFSFDDCQRRDYATKYNYRDYLEGSVERPALNTALLRFGYMG